MNLINDLLLSLSKKIIAIPFADIVASRVFFATATHDKRPCARPGRLGALYQDLVLMQVALEAFRDSKSSSSDFCLQTELDGVGQVDDLVFSQGNSITFKQIKHAVSLDNPEYSKGDLSSSVYSAKKVSLYA